MKSDFVITNNSNKVDLLEEELSYSLRGIFIEISKRYGYQFKESFYHHICTEYFIKKKIKFHSKRKVMLKSLDLGNVVDYYTPDFVIEDKIIIEIKAQKQIFSEHINQLTKYLKLSDYEVGFLVNFGSPMVQIIRRVSTNIKK